MDKEISRRNINNIKKYKAIYDENYFKKFEACYQNLVNKRMQVLGFSNYDNITSSASTLINEINITDPFLICQTVAHLLWMGYFSQDKKYIYSTDDNVIDNMFLGSGVMLGQGKCVNNSHLLRDILNKLDIWSASISISTEKGIIRKYGHSVVSFYDGDRIYFADPTNMDFLYFEDFLKIKGFVNEECKLNIRMPSLAWTGNVNKSHFDDIVDGPFRECKSVLKTKDDILNVDNNSIDIIRQNIGLIDDFYDYIRGDIDMVYKTLIKK